MSDQKSTRIVVVTDPAGVHARTAVAIAKVVRQLQAQVTLSKDAYHAAGTDVLQILSLGAPCGSSITIEVLGPDAEKILDTLVPIFTGEDQ